ncbi:hypothetical protein K474DRAFT_1705240 [Panus rudis PR-1116 ss-1]|nr:hypothetical protein K474DRAFT_1705240 [Panus rudis PR-1116 ss-1]
MSQLPPRPDIPYTPQPRYSDSRYPRPPPGSHDRAPAYPPRTPPRDRGDVYIPAASHQPRSRYTRPVDAYTPGIDRRPPASRELYPPPPPPRDFYPPPSPRDVHYVRDPYPPRFREDDRYHMDREWDRRGPPPPPDHRRPPREYRNEIDNWRDRDMDRPRRWPDDRAGYDWSRRERSPGRDRVYTRPLREDDRRMARDRAPPSPERTWLPRASRSPRRMGDRPFPGPRSVSRSRGRSASPPPRRRPESPNSAYHRRSPSRGSTRDLHSPGVLKLGNHSIDLGPPRNAPHREASERGRPVSPRSRRRSPAHSRSRSRSVARSSTRTPPRPRHSLPIRQDVLSPEPVLNNSRDQAAAFPSAPTFKEEVRPIASPAKEPSTTAAPSPGATTLDTLNAATVGSPKLSPKLSPAPKDTSSLTRPEAPKILLPEEKNDQPHALPRPPSRAEHSRAIPTQPRNYVKTPTTPMSPQVPSPVQNLPVKPEWASRASPLQATTPVHSEPVKQQGEQWKPQLHDYSHPRGYHFNFNEQELANLKAQKLRLQTEYATLAKASKRALHELDLASIDLRLAEQRRMVADAQLDKARAGQLGIDYVRPITSAPADK